MPKLSKNQIDVGNYHAYMHGDSSPEKGRKWTMNEYKEVIGKLIEVKRPEFKVIKDPHGK